MGRILNSLDEDILDVLEEKGRIPFKELRLYVELRRGQILSVRQMWHALMYLEDDGLINRDFDNFVERVYGD